MNKCGSDHDGYPATRIIEGLAFIIDGKPVVRVGDVFSCGGVVIGSGIVNIG